MRLSGGVIFVFLLIFSCAVNAADSLFFKVHFVYGSRPRHAFRTTEKNYFGGIHGGHVYVEADHTILSFGPCKGQWHVFGHRHRPVGCYRIDSNLVWCGDTGRLKMATVLIPVTSFQMQQFVAIRSRYLASTPYDYAFFGMRCAAAAYDVLSSAGLCRRRPVAGMVARNFYPKRLRVKLLRRARKEHWTVWRQEGRVSRRWEKD